MKASRFVGVPTLQAITDSKYIEKKNIKKYLPPIRLIYYVVQRT